MNKNLIILLMVATILLAGCVTIQENGPQSDPGLTPEPATPTPEIFNPLDPSPTPQASSLPLTCQVTDLNVYLDQDGGYCFAYPDPFRLDGESSGVYVVSPALDESLDPVRASLGIEVKPVPEASDLAHLVDGYLNQTGFQNLPWTIQRTELTLGGEPAIRIEPIPGLGSSRQVLALHGNKLFTLHFHPVDLAVGQTEVEALYQTVTGSFAFLDEGASSQPELAPQTVEWSEFGAKISLDYDPRLAPWVETLTLPTVPLSGEVLYSESHPAAAQFRFLGYMGGRLYDLPFLPFENRVAQVTVYQTSDFAGYGDGETFGFAGQLQALAELLQNGVDPARCAEPLFESKQVMPFLPWLNASQTFCAQPQVIDFNSGKGVRYLTFYTQGPAPVLESQVFYTFQGLTGDGKYYISASFPVTSGIFPNEPPATQVNPDPNAFLDEMKGQLAQLNALEASRFSPSLNVLDELVESIRITPEVNILIVPASQAQTGLESVTSNGLGAKISLDYDPRLAGQVEPLAVPAIPLNGEGLYAMSHPEAAQFQFSEYMGGQPYELPFLNEEDQVPHVAIYQTSDFSGFGEGEAFGFPNQLQALSDLLQTGVDPARCAEPLYEIDQSLPFLPWLNARQTFCAQPQIIDFKGGKGLRYLTHYSQGPAAALEGRIFYTFQGLTGDGKYYISAAFPVGTGIFPNQPPAEQIDTDLSAYLATLKGQVAQLNAQDADQFNPALTTLDALVSSIRIETP